LRRFLDIIAELPSFFTLDFAACMDGEDKGQLAMLMSVEGAVGSAVVPWCCRRERGGFLGVWSFVSLFG